VPLPRPDVQIASINKAIGASSAIAMQCKSIVQEYLPQVPRGAMRF
jgi:hypothetical protein